MCWIRVHSIVKHSGLWPHCWGLSVCNTGRVLAVPPVLGDRVMKEIRGVPTPSQP